MMAFRTLRSKCALLAPVCLLVLGAANNAAADTITVGWDQASSTVGYRVHIGSQSGSYTQHFDVGSSTLFAFTSAVAGQRYCFAVSAYLLSTRLEGPNSSEVCGYSNASPTLVNPGNRTSTVGQPTSLQLQGYDSQPLTYSASGLPPGLSIQASTGYISGTGTTAGTYSVTARASDGVLSTSQSFSWTMTTSSTSGSGGTTTPPPSGTDSTRPTVTIGSPTTSTSFSMNGSSIVLSGTTYDAFGVTQVRWENENMRRNGVASGLTNWTTTVPLQAGQNLIYITAIDAAGNEGADYLYVNVGSTTGGSTGGSTGGTTDTTAPTVTIGSPTTGSSYTTTQSYINLSGTAADGYGVSRVVWRNTATGASGTASGTTSWAAANIALVSGTNVIEISAYDAAGNRGADSLLVTRSSTTTTTPPPPSTSCPTASTVSICTPTTGTSFTTTLSSISMTGTAPSVITRVVWENVSNGARGVASGTTSWSVASIPLAYGSNLIEVTAYDSSGYPTTDRLLVTR